ncbi:MAG: DUF460 domain-containing protein [Candidatus Aenigmatarchaeota archaeon]
MKFIAGIDPGKTVGVAVIDIASDHYQTFSFVNVSINDICDLLISIGEPIIIATDKMIASEGVRKISATFNARLFLPKKDITINEKKELTRNFSFNNNHERDALASAIFAKKEFANLFGKIEYVLRKKNLSYLSDEVKELLIKNEVGNIEQAIKFLLRDEIKHETKIIPKIIETKLVKTLRKKIELLEKNNETLRNQILELKNENKRLVELIRKKNESKIIKNLRKSIATLIDEKNKIMNEYRNFVKIKELENEFYIVWPAERFEKIEDMKNKVILDNGKIDIKAIEKYNPKAIITNRNIISDVPIIRHESINIREIDNFLVIDKKELDNAIKKSFLLWLDAYKERFHGEKNYE